MKIIDFHTHCFPDKIANGAISKLSKIANSVERMSIMCVNDGTVSGLLNSMNEYDINAAVVMNIATGPSQVENVNSFAIEINETYDNLYAFGSVHPDNGNFFEEMKRLKSSGINGIKIHPDYIGKTIDDVSLYPIFEACTQLDMFLCIHAGWDFISPNLIHATPDKILSVITKFPKLKFVAAHMGGNLLWNEVEELLIGKNLWIDTSLACLEMNKSQAERMINHHDSEKILFGSDMPWCSASVAASYIDSLNITQSQKENIFYKNTMKIVG